MSNVLIVLNYNDWKTTKTLINKVEQFQCFEKILVVDNASTDNSVKELQKLETGKIKVIISSKNKGYASGNNFGIFYALENYNPEFLTIANPDVEFEESTIFKAENTLRNDMDFGMASALVYKGYNAWKLPGFFGVLQSLFPLQRFLKKFFYRIRLANSQRDYEVVDVIEGSLFCVKATAMKKVGGFDEKTFLYGEENLLAVRMRRAGYRSVILTKETYYHYHSVSVSKHYKKKTEIFRFIQAGYRIYCEDYLSINPLQRCVFIIAVQLAFMERKVFDFIMSLLIGKNNGK